MFATLEGNWPSIEEDIWYESDLRILGSVKRFSDLRERRPMTARGASGFKTEPIDLDSMVADLNDYEKRYGMPSARLHEAFRGYDYECEDQRAWAGLYSTLRAFGRA